MTGPTATCEVFIDDYRVFDRGDDLTSGFVTALSGLSIAWGRDGQNEQPGPASCSMEFLDPEGSNDILDVLHVGSSVSVWAEGQVSTGDTAWGPSTFDDAQAQVLYPDGPIVFGDDHYYAYLSVNASRLSVESQTLRVDPHPTNAVVGVRIPPRKFSPPDTLPNAWDDIPRMQPGETYRWSMRIKAPVGLMISTDMRWVFAPYQVSYIPSPVYTNTRTTYIGTGVWETVNGEVTLTSWGSSGTPPAEGAWLTLDPDYPNPYNSGKRWNQQTTTWAVQTSTWDSWEAWGAAVWFDNFAVTPPADTERRVLVFSGSISDIMITPDGGGVTMIKTTAMDLGAKLGNTNVGDVPWPAQPLNTRAQRIAALAGVTVAPPFSAVKIDPPLGALQVSYRDVDSQPALGLLQDLAQTAGGIFWTATHAVTGPYLWIENPDERAATSAFVETGSVIVIAGNDRGTKLVSACDVLEDGVAWRQDTADVITVVAVTWLEQGVDDEAQPTTTERTITVTDTAALATYGTRRLSVSTELTSSSDATTLANRMLSYARAVGWRLDGLTLDTFVSRDTQLPSVDDLTRIVTLLDLLDGTTRMGAALTLVDMPSYAPRGAISSSYVEGGRYDFVDGYWRLELSTSPSSGQGHSASWQEIATAHPAWKWNQWAPSILWVDTFGVTV